MHCKHLLHYSHNACTWSVASCSAKNAPYVPSLVELEKFCQCGRHTVCPAYLFSFAPGSAAREGRASSGINNRHLTRRKSA
jgi:hypothetical protein